MAERILVTGGAGFIGSHVAEGYLAAGHDVLVLDDLSSGRRENVPAGAGWVGADVRDAAAVEAAFRSFRPTVVNHHAAQKSVTASVREPVLDADVNVLGLLNLLQASVAHGVRRFVFASTGGALYGSGAPVPVAEDFPPAPDAPYGLSKLAGEQYLGLYGRLHGLESVILRYANVYGPRQDPYGEAGVVAIFCGAVLRGKSCVIFGDGRQTRDYVHVADAVASNLLALEGPPGAYNIGTGVETSVNRLVEELRRVHGGPVAVEHAAPRPGEVRRVALDVTLARERLGWAPRIPVAEGLAQTYAWFREHLGRERAGERAGEPAVAPAASVPATAVAAAAGPAYATATRPGDRPDRPAPPGGGARRVRKAVVPAAGMGTRFLPATKAQPKEMLPLVDTPVIQLVVEEALAAGVEGVLLVTGRNKRAIEDHFDRAPELEYLLAQKGDLAALEAVRRLPGDGVIHYVRQREPRGLGHAVLAGRHYVGEEPFCVLLADEVFEGPAMGAVLEAYDRVGATVLGVKRVPPEETSRYGMVAVEGEGPLYRVTDLVEKPEPGTAPSDLAIVGRYALAAEIFGALERTPPGRGGEIQLTDGLRLLLAEGHPIYGLELPHRRFDVGERLGFVVATLARALERPDLRDGLARWLETEGRRLLEQS